MKILVVGSVNMDLVIQTERFPAQGETRQGKGFSTIPGGKGANQAVAAAKLGAQTKMLGAVGEDAYGEILKEHLASAGVEIENLKIFPGNSGVAVILVCGGDNRIILDAGANGKITPAYLEEQKEIFSWADQVVLQFEIPMEAVLKAADLAKEAGAEVWLNPAPFEAIPEKLLKNVDWLILNETEAAAMCQMPVTNIEEAEQCAYAIAEQFAGKVVLTLGKEGCLFREDGIWKRMPAFAVKTVDTTAAGDCFIGALCAAAGEDNALTERIRYATAAAAITVSRVGAGSAIPSANEVRTFLQCQK